MSRPDSRGANPQDEELLTKEARAPVMRVEFHSAQAIANVDWLSSQDPYGGASLIDENNVVVASKKTGYVEEGGDSFTFTKDHSNKMVFQISQPPPTILKLELWNCNSSLVEDLDQLIGYVKVPLPLQEYEAGLPTWYELDTEGVVKCTISCDGGDYDPWSDSSSMPVAPAGQLSPENVRAPINPVSSPTQAVAIQTGKAIIEC
jgi:hypothetical protein